MSIPIFVQEDLFGDLETESFIEACIDLQERNRLVFDSTCNRHRIVQWFQSHNDGIFRGSLDLTRQCPWPTTHYLLNLYKYNEMYWRRYIVPELLLNANTTYVFGCDIDVNCPYDHFVRCITGDKRVAGDLIDECGKGMRKMGRQMLRSDNPHDILLLAPPQLIKHEFRFLVWNGVIVTGSQYIQNGRSIQEHKYEECDNKVKELAQWVLSQCPYLVSSMDHGFVLDLSIGDNCDRQSVRIIEINGLMTSGHYGCDPLKLLEVMFSTKAS